LRPLVATDSPTLSAAEHERAMSEYRLARIEARTRILQLVIDARGQHFPQETPHVYRPLAGREDGNRWSKETRATVLKNHNQLDIFI
jgi:hypothetical protein